MSQQQWYISRKGERYGPYNWEQMCNFAGSGHLVPVDLVWVTGMSDWVKAAGIDGLFKSTKSATEDPQSAYPPQQAEKPKPQHQSQPEQAHASTQYSNSTDARESEEIVGVIPAVRRKTGVFSSKTYSLVATNRRLIFAELTNKMLKQAAEDAIRESKEQGKGFFARTAATATSSQRIYNRYRQMTPEEILEETPGNYAIEYRDISSIKIRHGMFREEQGQYDNDEMHIKTNREKIKCIFEYSNSREAKKLLRGLLGKIVR